VIAHVRGQVAALTLNSAVIDVGGVGLLVLCTPSTLAELRLGSEVLLHTSMVVREDSLTIYGFSSAAERDMFELVQTASGIGPKVAQAMLAVLSPDRLRQAIASSDLVALTQVPGIGKKGAERIVVELRDRVGSATAEASPVAAAWQVQVHEALTGLGWSTRDADLAIVRVAEQSTDSSDVPMLLRLALRSLAKER
jgi:holliday junction DNA helicase RuvA